MAAGEKWWRSWERVAEHVHGRISAHSTLRTLIVPAKFGKHWDRGGLNAVWTTVFPFPHEEWLAGRKLKSPHEAGARSLYDSCFGATDCEWISRKNRIPHLREYAEIQGRSCDRSLQSGGDLE